MSDRNPNPNPSSKHEARVAFEQTAADRQAIPPGDLAPVNLDVVAVHPVALAAIRKVRSLRPRIVETMKQFDLEQFDKLETYLWALWYAHLAFRAASEPRPHIGPIAENGAKLRDQLIADARALAKRGFLDTVALSKLTGNTGYKNIAVDLGTLVVMFRTRWADVSTNSGVKAAEVDAAEQLSTDLMRAVATQEEQAAMITDATEQRSRAFVLFARAYDQARRVATYLCWGASDVDDTTPSLYTNRGPATYKPADDAASSEGSDVAPARPITPSSVTSSNGAGSFEAHIPGGPGGNPLMSS